MYNIFIDKHGNEWGSEKPWGEPQIISWGSDEAKAAYSAEIKVIAAERKAAVAAFNAEMAAWA